jgi:hypothetical protein
MPAKAGIQALKGYRAQGARDIQNLDLRFRGDDGED